MHATLLRHIFHLIEQGHVSLRSMRPRQKNRSAILFTGLRTRSTVVLSLCPFGMRGEQVTAPLFDPATQPPTQNNSAYMKEYVCSEILRSFPNLSRRNVEVFVVGLFDLNKDLASYKAHLRDFLIQSKVHSPPSHSPTCLPPASTDPQCRYVVSFSSGVRERG